ncbi:hypothetical protein AMJ85_08930 [candidate division BRC1 bacterium SM23_51]|nr:MAG: hypothetical protein AMJ85_08930 [candidate division BRC1 bacterium SM23_51]
MPALRQQGRAGFTLLEIIIAVTIFGIVSIAIYSTFRVGLRSYEVGREQMVVTQTARVVFNLLERDLRAIYYMHANAYNQNLVRQLQFRAMKTIQTQGAMSMSDTLTGAPTSGRAMPRTPDARQRRSLQRRGEDGSAQDGEEEEPLSGIPIDLTIVGTDDEGGDCLTFACYQIHWGTAPVEPWSLARVKYSVEEGNLYRAEGPIAVEEVPEFQWRPPPPPEGADGPDSGRRTEAPQTPQEADHYLEDAPRELVARDVKVFDIRYGYWTEEGWFEAPDWIAHEHRYRNPPQDLDPLDPKAQMVAQYNRSRPNDDVPAYAVVTLGLGYGKDNARTRLFRSRIRLPNSLETYEPLVDPALAIGSGQPTVPVPPPTPFDTPGARTPPR